MIARGSELAVTLVMFFAVCASGLLGATISPGDGAGDRVFWFLAIAMLGGGCTGFALSAVYASYLPLTNRRVVDAPIFTLRSLLLVITCYAVVCSLVVGCVPPQERGLLVSWAFCITVQTLLLLGAWNRLKSEDGSEEVTRFSLLKRGFLLAACSGIVPVLAWLTMFAVSCHDRFGGSPQTGELYTGLVFLFLLVLVPLELLAIAVAFVLLVRVRFHLSLALLLSAILLSTVVPSCAWYPLATLVSVTMNDCDPAKPYTSGAEERWRGLTMPVYARAAIYGVAWLPFLSLLAFFVPRFEDMFRRLRERGEGQLGVSAPSFPLRFCASCVDSRIFHSAAKIGPY